MIEGHSSLNHKITKIRWEAVEYDANGTKVRTWHEFDSEARAWSYWDRPRPSAPRGLGASLAEKGRIYGVRRVTRTVTVDRVTIHSQLEGNT